MQRWRSRTTIVGALGWIALGACGEIGSRRELGEIPERPSDGGGGFIDDDEADDDGGETPPPADDGHGDGGTDSGDTDPVPDDDDAPDDSPDDGEPSDVEPQHEVVASGRGSAAASGYFVQLVAAPTQPIDGRFGVHAWQYVNPTNTPAGLACDQSGWMGFDANGNGKFRIHMGHGRQASNMQDLFIEVHSAPAGTVLTCNNPEGGGSVSSGTGIISCFSSAYAHYGVPTEGWYEVAAGDVWLADRWQLQIRFNGQPFATVDFDNFAGFSGQHHVAEMSNWDGRDLAQLYAAGFRWGASFAGFDVATDNNGVDGPWLALGGGVSASSAIFGDGIATQWGKIGCDAAAPGGDGHVVQALQWFAGFPTSSAGGTSPPIAGSCY